jgi:hypothetical protein
MHASQYLLKRDAVSYKSEVSVVESLYAVTITGIHHVIILMSHIIELHVHFKFIGSSLL